MARSWSLVMVAPVDRSVTRSNVLCGFLTVATMSSPCSQYVHCVIPRKGDRIVIGRNR